MYPQISGLHTFSFRALGSLTVMGWRREHSGTQWQRSWCRCIRAFALPASLWILCCAILARKRAIMLIFTNHSRVSFYRCPYLVMPGKHNTPRVLFSVFGMRFLDYLLRFHYCGARKPLFSHFAHIPGKTLVGLFKLYLTPLSRYSC